jgi:hypothetical protein
MTVDEFMKKEVFKACTQASFLNGSLKDALIFIFCSGGIAFIANTIINISSFSKIDIIQFYLAFGSIISFALILLIMVFFIFPGNLTHLKNVINGESNYNGKLAFCDGLITGLFFYGIVSGFLFILTMVLSNQA